MFEPYPSILWFLTTTSAKKIFLIDWNNAMFCDFKHFTYYSRPSGDTASHGKNLALTVLYVPNWCTTTPLHPYCPRQRVCHLVIDSGLAGSWEGCCESRRCSRDTYQESYITNYTSIRREEIQRFQGLSTESHDQNLALTVSYVPNWCTTTPSRPYRPPYVVYSSIVHQGV